jgi:uncharacterized membrane protein (UPF0127 family)
LRRPTISVEDGLLIVPGGSIHTMGMRCKIDVVFLSRQMRVLGLAPNVAPWRFRVAPRGTRRVLELAAGQITAIGLTRGTYVVVESSASQTRSNGGSPESSAHWCRRACQRLPIQFSLRLPLERHCKAAISTKCSTRRDSLHGSGTRQ